MTNAAKFTPANGHIQVDCHRDKGGVSLEILYNGLGLEPHILPRICDVFKQSERSLDRAQGGLGVGFPLAERMVEVQGERILACSPGLGKGSTFSVSIPLFATPDMAYGIPSLAIADTVDISSRILVVDDNEDHATMLSSTLRHKGHSVQTAHTGPDGLKIAEEWIPDVLLLDIGLPGLNGYEIACRLRANESTSKIRLIALTGYGQESDRALTREEGFDAHLVKPYDFAELEKLMGV